MNTLTLLVVLVNLLVTAGLWAFVSVRLRSMETTMTGFFHMAHHMSMESSLREEEFSLWSYRDDQWQLIRPCTAPGLEVGPPPSRDGRFANEIVRTRGIESGIPVSV